MGAGARRSRSAGLVNGDRARLRGTAAARHSGSLAGGV